MRRNESGILGSSSAPVGILPEAGKVRRSWRDGWTSTLCRCRIPSESKQQRQRKLALGCLLSLVAAALLLANSGVVGWLMETPMSNPGRVLLVTAHPDDEVIFFASTVTALHSSGLEVFLLCLTNGDAYGLGDLRERELRAAAAALQINAEHLTILNDTRIQDGHHEDWEEEYVAHMVQKEVLRRGINTIITFDADGVTGHLNHEGCYNGVRHYITECARSSQAKQAKRASTCPDSWALTTTDDFRTFSSVLDVLPSAVEARGDKDAAMFLNHDLPAMFRAMSAHKSQSRWWRHVLLTRYTFVNTLERIKPLGTDWALPLQTTPGKGRAGEDSGIRGQGPAAAKTGSAAGAAAVHKRSAFQMRSMSRAILRNNQ